MTVVERLRGVRRVFLDTAPVIYYVEENQRYLPVVDVVFGLVDAGALVTVSSPVTLAECLVMPYRRGEQTLVKAFLDLLVESGDSEFITIGRQSAEAAAAFRTRYALPLADSFQIALALESRCEVLLTNDKLFQRITEIDVVLLDEMTP